MTEFFVNFKTLFVILHLFGVALGAGGAFMSDGMFFIAIKDRFLSLKELEFMRLGSTITWVGLALLYVSGAALFMSNPAVYAESSKFITKMFIVLMLTINGVYFHLSHIPFLNSRADKKFSDLPDLKKKRAYLLASGVVSVVSWSLAIILGALRSIPFTVAQGISLYLVLVVVGIGVAIIFRDHFLPLE